MAISGKTGDLSAASPYTTDERAGADGLDAILGLFGDAILAGGAPDAATSIESATEIAFEASGWGQEFNLLVLADAAGVSPDGDLDGRADKALRIRNFPQVDLDLSPSALGVDVTIENATRVNAAFGDGDDMLLLTLLARFAGGPFSSVIDTGAGADVVTLAPGVAQTVAGDGAAFDASVTDGAFQTLTIRLGDGDDRFVNGTSALSIVDGGADDDDLTGGDGLDLLSGGDGDDTLRGEGGEDILDGGRGRDEIYGGGADDVIQGGRARDVIEGEDGDDVLAGDGGNDRVVGGKGADTIEGGGGKDRLAGNAGDDLARGGAGGDLIFGGPGEDTLNGDAGADTLQGDAGDDLLDGGSQWDEARFGDPLVAGGALGFDVAIEVGGPSADGVVVLDVDGSNGDHGADTVRAIETASFGGAPALRLFVGDPVAGGTLNGAGAAASLLVGGAGAETLGGGGEGDALFGQGGGDYARGRDGDDTISGGAGDDTLEGEAGDDRLFGGEGTDRALFEDPLVVGLAIGYAFVRNADGSLTVRDVDASNGDLGADVLVSIEELGYGAGEDFRLILAPSDDGALIEAGAGVEAALLVGGDGDDTATGAATDDVADGGEGADSLDGGAGGDTLIGGAGGDALIGGAGDGADLLSGGAEDDTLTGGAGDDTLDGGADADLAVFAGALLDVAAPLFGFSVTDEGALIVADLDGADGDEGTDLLIDVEAARFDGVDYDLAVAPSNAGESFAATGGPALVVGGSGADDADGSAAGDVLFGGAGADTLSGLSGLDTLYGGQGDDLVQGDGAAGEGVSGRDLLFGGDGLDTLDGGAGGDTMTGGADADLFRVGVDDGNDTVLDFVLGEDSLEIDGPTPGLSRTISTEAELLQYMNDIESDNNVTTDAIKDGDDLYLVFTRIGNGTTDPIKNSVRLVDVLEGVAISNQLLAKIDGFATGGEEFLDLA
ncbi:MAG: calcium-binding protein [Pseudomonadota bacterium]